MAVQAMVKPIDNIGPIGTNDQLGGEIGKDASGGEMKGISGHKEESLTCHWN